MHENHEQPTARELHKVVVGSVFNGGVRIYDISEPAHPREIAAYVPDKPPNSRTTAIQINDMFVDNNGVIYAGDCMGAGYTSWSTRDPCHSPERSAFDGAR